MIYLIGGAPRTGKSTLCHQFAAEQKIGWISTDMLIDLLRFHRVEGIKTEWNASPKAIAANAEWFFPTLERFIWGANSLADSYAIEGVDFLPAQVVQLAERFPIRAVFLGCSGMTPERFDQFPGRSKGYAALPETLRSQFARDVPRWSEFIQQEAAHFDFPYIDTSDDFPFRLIQAQALLKGRAE